jgi:hypothetical protein
MGNMSNPLINRWGLNLFWYKFWYVDKNLSKNIHQDALIDKLIYLFLNYGLFTPKIIFRNNYWFQNEKKNYFSLYFSQYYRAINFKNKILNINAFYYNRIKIKNIYFSKLWILKYQNWIVVNIYSFQPLKKLNISINQNIMKRDVDGYLFNRNKNFKIFKRLKFLFLYFFKTSTNVKMYYLF